MRLISLDAFELNWVTAGMISPNEARVSRALLVLDTRGSNCWFFRVLIPPAKKAIPSPKSRLPMIEPVSDDFTMLTRPAWSANEEMMISGALPRVAFSRPPSVGPRYRARISVASPISPTSGTIARADAAKTRSGLALSQSRPSATGMNTSSQFKLIGSAG